MAASKPFGWLDPNVDLAAQAGDPGAMRILSQYLFDMSQYVNNLAEQLLFAAAQAGDPEAKHGQHNLHADPWRELHLHGTTEHNAPDALRILAGWLTAVEDSARSALTGENPVDVEARLRLQAEAGSLESALKWAEILEKRGQAEEAAAWRARTEALLDAREEEAGRVYGLEVAEVAMTALVTTAVMPFLQALAGKVAEDAYGQARQMVRQLLRRNGRRGGSNEESSRPSPLAAKTEPGLAVLQDPDAGITLFLWSNASDEALRALSSLDLGELTLRRPDQGQVHLVWHPVPGEWHVRGS